jgi:outer membrane protein
MKIERTLLLLALAALVVLTAAAEDEPTKIGVVDVDQAFNSTDDGKAAREEMARKQREAEAEVAPLIQEFETMKDELQAKRFVLSDEALFQRKLDLKQLQDTIQLKVKALEGNLQVAQTRLEGPLHKKLMEIIDEAGKGAGYTMIFSRGAEGVLYSREAVDITELVIEKYNQKS